MSWELIERVEPQEESTGAYLGRTAARTGARAAEAVAGLPGNVLSAAHGVAKFIAPSYAEVANKENLPNILPTTQNIREGVTQKLTGQYLEPQTSSEQFLDDITEDAATLLLPIPGAPKTGLINKFAKALGTSTAGNFAKWAGEELVGPKTGQAAKMGAMLATNMLGSRKSIDNLRNNLYAQRDEAIPAKTTFGFMPERKQLNDVINNVKKRDFKGKDFVLDRLKSFDNVEPGDVKGLIKLKEDWNSYFDEAQKFSKTASHELNQGVGILNKGIERYGKTNPKFYNPHLQAEELTAALKSNNAIQRFVNKSPLVQNSLSNPIVKHALFGLGYAGANAIGGAPVLGAATAVLGAREGLKAAQLLWKSPLARKSYSSFFTHALANNAAGAVKDIAKLNKIADHLEDDYEYELIG